MSSGNYPKRAFLVNGDKIVHAENAVAASEGYQNKTGRKIRKMEDLGPKRQETIEAARRHNG